MTLVRIEKICEAQIKQRKIMSWDIWTKEISRFEWYYDCQEECLILDGEIIVETDDGNFSIFAGDFVTFSKGLHCVWNVIKPVSKHYKFSETL